MADGAKAVTYPAHHWGPLAADPWRTDIFPDSTAWRAAVKRAWLHDGNSEAAFEELFGADYAPRIADPAYAPQS